MINDYLKSITPDSLSGLLFGFEGIQKSVVILNGPTGCKFYHSITVDNQSLRKDDYDPLNYPEEWFFGQGRVPCTYLDKRDYVYGSSEKLDDIIDFILSRTRPEILVVVNSPGAALIGDDLERIVRSAVERNCSARAADREAPESRAALGDATAGPIPVITCQSPGYSKDVSSGYSEACSVLIEALAGANNDDLPDETDNSKPETNAAGSGRTPVVNILGLSIYHKYHQGDIAEITRLLGLAGIKVNTTLLCESTLEEIKKIGAADLNILLDPEYGLESAKLLERKYGTPYVSSGYPVGFRAAEEMLKSVFDELGNAGFKSIKMAPALEDIEKARATSYIHIARMSSLTGLPKGVPFAVHAPEAIRKGYSDFLTGYLGMKEVSSDEKADIILADGNTIARLKADGLGFGGIEISLPSIGYIDVIPKTHIGASGGMLLIEQILNGLNY